MPPEYSPAALLQHFLIQFLYFLTYSPLRLVRNAWMILEAASHTNTRNHLGRSEGLTPINVNTSAGITNPAIQLIVTMKIISPFLTASGPLLPNQIIQPHFREFINCVRLSAELVAK